MGFVSAISHRYSREGGGGHRSRALNEVKGGGLKTAGGKAFGAKVTARAKPRGGMLLAGLE